MEAAHYALEGNFVTAVRLMNECVDSCPAMMEDELLMQLEKYKQKELYLRDETEAQFYMRGISFSYFY